MSKKITPEKFTELAKELTDNFNLILVVTGKFDCLASADKERIRTLLTCLLSDEDATCCFSYTMLQTDWDVIKLLLGARPKQPNCRTRFNTELGDLQVTEKDEFLPDGA